jgi:hypothetical protein
MKPHPTNPHGVLVPCANCGKEIHLPRAEGKELDPSRVTCSYRCMTTRLTIRRGLV